MDTQTKEEVVDTKEEIKKENDKPIDRESELSSFDSLIKQLKELKEYRKLMNVLVDECKNSPEFKKLIQKEIETRANDYISKQQWDHKNDEKEKDEFPKYSWKDLISRDV